jgi:endonuclease VIII
MMPEGHLLHRFAHLHREHLGGRAISASSPQGRFAEAAARIDGRVLDEVEAYGKHLFHRFDGSTVHIHLGRQGTLLWLPAPPPAPRTSVRLRMSADAGAADLIAPLRCELGEVGLRDRVVSGLGPDPLRADADPDQVWSGLQATGRAVGAALLDQSLVAGIGNVLRAELLNLTGVHPETPASSIDRATFDALWRTTVDVMTTAVEEGRIITRRPAGATPADLDEIEGRFVYKRDTCGRCGTPVEGLTLANRAINACPVCQPRQRTYPEPG